MRRPAECGDPIADELWREEVRVRSAKAGEWQDMFTTDPDRFHPIAIQRVLTRLPKCLARKPDGTIVKREDL